jgi:hypothetical protein
MIRLSHTWGTTSAERLLAFPSDTLISNPDDALFRGVTISAPPQIVFLWLCQMRLAPYSYDLIDNGGRPSPPELTPGLDNLAVGQDVMRIFTLVDFERNRQLTLRLKPRSSATKVFGDIAVSYVICPIVKNAGEPNIGFGEEADSCRLLVKLVVKCPNGIKGSLMRTLLPWGDLIMMRRQLLNLKQLAEQTARLRQTK